MTSIADPPSPRQPGGLEQAVRLDAIARHRAMRAGLQAAGRLPHGVIFSEAQMRHISDAAIDAFLALLRPGTMVDLLWAIQQARRETHE